MTRHLSFSTTEEPPPIGVTEERSDSQPQARHVTQPRWPEGKAEVPALSAHWGVTPTEYLSWA